MKFRVGQGVDTHKLVKGRPLILGGITIRHELGLEGHSDADVLLHACIDALFGASSLGDIGSHFPNTDKQWKDVSSIKLLKICWAKVQERGWDLTNLDMNLICEAPRIAPYILEIRENISQALGVEAAKISLKAGTNEGLGFVGRGEGISALAVVLLQGA